MTGIHAGAPKVSICVITYNHERFIERCLRSLLDQQADFDFEIIVGDDCSTDETGVIVDRLAASDGRIRVLRPDRNIGVTQNLLAVYNAATSPYVVHLDGDDYVAPGKLAGQVALLDREPALVACGHRMTFVDEQGTPIRRTYPARLGPTTDLQHTIRYGMPFLASSLMYRREARTLRTSEFEIFDWYFLTDILKAGPAGYIDEPLGFYTVNTQSLTATLRSIAMRARMLGLFERRLADLPQFKADFFCKTMIAALMCIRLGEPITRQHWRLLRSSFTPKALLLAPDTLVWHLENLRALSR